MNENVFWIKIWRTLALAAVLVVASLSGCVINQSYLVANMVEKGIDPIAASCAFTDSSRAICVVLAAKNIK